MKVIWTPEAEQDRLDIWDYIATDNPTAAVRMDELFSAATASLKVVPDKGKLGQIVGTRELIPHENYRLIYQAENDAVWILALVHVSPGCGPRSRVEQQARVPFDAFCMPQIAKAPETL